MKIISWNCNRAFRNKFSIIQKYDADIYVIQECENPKKYPKEFSQFLTNYVWVGENENQGLGIFAKPNIKMVNNDWPVYCLRHFVSVKINDCFDLVGVWASPPYIEEYFIYQSINIDKYGEGTILIGDFNSNAIWDKDHGKRNHSVVVEQLKSKNIVSAYHMSGIQHGKEKDSTFYLHRNIEKKFHIDYCFLNPRNFKSFVIYESESWLKYSDHMPIQVELEIQQRISR